MNIKAYFMQQTGEMWFSLWDVFVDKKHYPVAWGIGEVEGGEPKFSDVARVAMKMLEVMSKGRIKVIPVPSVRRAKEIVEKALDMFDPETPIFFLCKTSEVIDAVHKAVHPVPPNQYGYNPFQRQ